MFLPNWSWLAGDRFNEQQAGVPLVPAVMIIPRACFPKGTHMKREMAGDKRRP
jgi:hypothetical protein